MEDVFLVMRAAVGALWNRGGDGGRPAHETNCS